MKTELKYYFIRLVSVVIILTSISNSINAQELTWIHTGGPMGGVVGDIAINSQGEIFAGMYPLLQNGLYKSTDNGNTWNKTKTQFEDFAILSIYITKKGHIWVGTDNQAALYRSTDDGLTWENKNNGFFAAECWAIGESKDGVLFAGNGDGGGLYRSTNNGDSWELMTTLSTLAFAADSNNVSYAGTFSGLYISTDDGLNWTQNNFLSNIPVSSVLIDTSNNIYCGTGYYSGGDGVFFSEDGGQNWKQLGLEGKVVLSLAFDTEGNLYAGTLNDGLYKTSDLGQNWEQFQNGIYRKDVYRLKINQENDIFIGAEGNGVTGYGDGGVFRSTDSGNSFEQVGLPVSLVKNIVFSGDSVIIAATPSGVQKYNRLTKNWNNVGLYKVEAITITPSNTLYAATQDEGLYKSTNLGESWALTTLTVDTLMPVYNVLAINEDTLFASTFYNLRRSTNGGEDWEVLPIKTSEGTRGFFYSNNILWLIGVSSFTSVLYKTIDHGNSFDSLYTGFDTFGSNNPIAAINNGYVFLSSRNSIINGIIRSTDNGLNWENVLPINNAKPTVFANDEGIVLTGTIVLSNSDTNKIFISTNFGVSWISKAQPTSFGIDLTDIKQDETGKYFTGTSGEGLYEVDIITKVENESSDKYGFYLSQNYPNPFNPLTKIRYSLSTSNLVQINIYNILGQEIINLLNERKQAGVYEIEFDGSKLPSGVYFYRIVTGHYSETKKMMLIK